MVNCANANTGNAKCESWLKEHEYCNGCPDIAPIPAPVNANRGYASLALELALGQRKPAPQLTMRFKFSSEMLQDEPQKCRDIIVDRLAEHFDKIERFEVEAEVTEDTMQPMVSVRVWLTNEFVTVDNILERLMKIK